MAHMRAWPLIVILLSPCSAAWTIAAAEQEPASTLNERVEVLRFIRPIFVEPAGPQFEAGCRDLRPDQITIQLKGYEAEVKKIDRRHRPTNHVLLLDTSDSMREELSILKKAATAYVSMAASRLPVDSLGIFAFNHDLLLEMPITPLHEAGSVERLHREIDKVEIFQSLTDFDSTWYQLKLFLGSLPNRSVVIMISDGLAKWTFAPGRIQAEIAAQLDNITLMAIGLPGVSHDGRKTLRKMAEDSGGRSYFVPHAEDIGEAFDDILSRIASEAYVTFALTPNGKKLDGVSPIRHSRLKIASTRGSCKIHHSKFWSDPRDMRFVYQGDITPDNDDPDFQGIVFESDPVDDIERLHATVTDLVNDGVFHFEDNRLQNWRDAVVQRARRELEVMVTPPQLLRETPIEVSDLFLAWMLEGRELPPPVFLHTMTFIELRMQLAKILLDHLPAYDREASDVMTVFMRQEVRAAIEDHFRSSATGQTQDSRNLRDAIELSLESRQATPIDSDLKVKLGSMVHWLGDVRALDVSTRIEEATIHSLLANHTERVDAVQRSWPVLAGWLAPPRSIRIAVPMHLFYDPSRKQFGFFRLLLPREVNEGEFLLDTIPDRPFAVELVKQLVPPEAYGSVAEVTVDYTPVSFDSLSGKIQGRLKSEEQEMIREQAKRLWKQFTKDPTCDVYRELEKLVEERRSSLRMLTIESRLEGDPDRPRSFAIVLMRDEHLEHHYLCVPSSSDREFYRVDRLDRSLWSSPCLSGS